MQQSRFELKYLMKEETALRIRDFVQCYLDFDEYSVGKPDNSYEVHSIYLDSDDLQTYWWTINGNRNRFKLRVRFYDDRPESPVFFELKRRHNACILKQRGAVRRDVAALLLSGHVPELGHVIAKSARQYTALQTFCEQMERLQASPKVHIAYLREAYVSSDDQQRVTFDRRVLAHDNLGFHLHTRMARPVLNFAGWTILELKFTNRFPKWFRELIEVFDLMQCGAAKYVESVQNLGTRRLQATVPVVNEAVGAWAGNGENLCAAWAPTALAGISSHDAD